MVTITIKTDFNDIDRKLRNLSLAVQQKAIPAALNKTIAKARTEMTRAITDEYNLRSAEVRSSLKIVNARKPVKDWMVSLDPFASNRRKGFSVNLIRFVEKRVSLAEGRRRAKSGVRNQVFFQIKKTGGKQTLSGAFIATNKRTGGTAVFTRVGKERYPIEAKQTIDIPAMFNARKIQARVLGRIEKDLPIEFDRAIKAALAGNIR